MRGPRHTPPGMIMTSGPPECSGGVMMVAGPPHGSPYSMQAIGPQPHHMQMQEMHPSGGQFPGDYGMNPDRQTANILEWEKLKEQHMLEKQKEAQRGLLPVASVAAHSQPPAPPAPSTRGSRPRGPRGQNPQVTGSRMSVCAPGQAGKPVVMVAPSPSTFRGRGAACAPRGSRMAAPRHLMAEQMAFMSGEEQMMMQQQQFMVQQGGPRPPRMQMMHMQGPMMVAGQFPEMMGMEGGFPPPEGPYAPDIGFLGRDSNRGGFIQDGGMGGGDPMMMGEYYGGPPLPGEFGSDGAPPVKMQMLQSAPGFDMDLMQSAAGPIQGGGQPTVNNTYVNATMSIQQLNIQNVGPPIQQIQGNTPPQFQIRQPLPSTSRSEGGYGHPMGGYPPFQPMAEPLTNLDSKVPSQKLQYFPTSRAPPQGAPSQPPASEQGQAPTPVPTSVAAYTPLGDGSGGLPPSSSSGSFGDITELGGLFCGGGQPGSVSFPMGQPPPTSQYGSFESFQQQLYAPNGGGAATGGT